MLVDCRLSGASTGVFGLLLPPFAPAMSSCCAASMLSSEHKNRPKAESVESVEATIF